MAEERRLWLVDLCVPIPNQPGQGPSKTQRNLLVRAPTAGGAARKALMLAKRVYKGERLHVRRVKTAGVIDD